MNKPLADDNQQQESSLVLFLAGDAPRSRRAQRNLSAALEATCPDLAPVHEIDLLREPQQAIDFGIFATPALLHIDAEGNRRLLYGDLSDEHRLTDFISVL